MISLPLYIWGAKKQNSHVPKNVTDEFNINGKSLRFVFFYVQSSSFLLQKWHYLWKHPLLTSNHCFFFLCLLFQKIKTHMFQKNSSLMGNHWLLIFLNLELFFPTSKLAQAFENILFWSQIIASCSSASSSKKSKFTGSRRINGKFLHFGLFMSRALLLYFKSGTCLWKYPLLISNYYLFFLCLLFQKIKTHMFQTNSTLMGNHWVLIFLCLKLFFFI